MENEKLVELIKQGHNEYMAELYENNKPIIKAIARKLQLDINDLEDAMQDAYFGLVAAVQAYDASKGYKFITFAQYHITTAINRGKHSIKHIPEYLQMKAFRIGKAQTELAQQLNRLPTAAETAAATGFSVKEIQCTLKAVMPPQSIETPLADDLTIADTIPDKGIDFENDIAEADYKQWLHNVVENMPGAERQAVTLYYFRGMTYKRMAELLKVSDMQSRQLVINGIRYLRNPRIMQTLLA